MPIPNPFALQRNLAMSGPFLGALAADIRTLLGPDLPSSTPPVARGRYPDDAAHAHAAQSIAQQWRFARVRQAVRKAQIRDTLWARLGLACRLFGFVSVPLLVLVIFVRVAFALAKL